jgi:hypothetical protein
MVVLEVTVRHLHNRHHAGRRRSDLIFDHRHNADERIRPSYSSHNKLLMNVQFRSAALLRASQTHSERPALTVAARPVSIE